MRRYVVGCSCVVAIIIGGYHPVLFDCVGIFLLWWDDMDRHNSTDGSRGRPMRSRTCLSLAWRVQPMHLEDPPSHSSDAWTVHGTLLGSYVPSYLHDHVVSSSVENKLFSWDSTTVVCLSLSPSLSPSLCVSVSTWVCLHGCVCLCGTVGVQEGWMDRRTNITAWPRTRTRTRTGTGTHLSCRHKLHCCCVPWETRGKKRGTKPKAKMGIQEKTNTCPPNSHRCVRTNQRWIDDVDLPLDPKT